MIPTTKNDEEALKVLLSSSDEQVIENAVQLLEWLQDASWPVFNAVVERLSGLGDKLLTPVSTILKGNDSIWKANIIGHLIPTFSLDTQRLYTKSLEALLAEYNESDLREGVIDFIEIQLSNVRENT